MKKAILSALLVFVCASVSAQNIIHKVPKSYEFAGQTIRFDRADMRERLDRELVAFTYSHTNSILMIKRANRIFPVIEPILKENGVPDDLKYLCVIESVLDPQALSSAGAAGLWQFMPATAKSYGMEVNSNVDERYNIRLETAAACKYLKEAYERYGDWLTAAASYNAGKGSISSKLEAQHQTKATDLWLVSETSRYMFRIMVAKMFLENPQAFGFNLTAEDLYPYIPPREYVTVTKPIPDLADFADSLGISFADLKRSNLWLRENSLQNKSGKRYQIEVPDTKAEFYDPSKTKVHNPAWVK